MAIHLIERLLQPFRLYRLDDNNTPGLVGQFDQLYLSAQRQLDYCWQLQRLVQLLRQDRHQQAIIEAPSILPMSENPALITLQRELQRYGEAGVCLDQADTGAFLIAVVNGCRKQQQSCRQAYQILRLDFFRLQQRLQEQQRLSALHLNDWYWAEHIDNAAELRVAETCAEQIDWQLTQLQQLLDGMSDTLDCLIIH